jgi:hypothetical protein
VPISIGEDTLGYTWVYNEDTWIMRNFMFIKCLSAARKLCHLDSKGLNDSGSPMFLCERDFTCLNIIKNKLQTRLKKNR